MATSRSVHRSVSGASPHSSAFRPEVGGITLLPDAEASPLVRDAIIEAGGSLVPLGDETRAVIWLANEKPETLVEVLETHPKVQWVQLPWAGVDKFADALRELTRDDLLWTSAKGAYAQPVAEHAVMLVLALLRNIGTRARANSWGDKMGESLYGSNVVIVGAGGIAVELMRLLEPFDTRITVVRRSDGDVEGAARTVTSDRIDEVLPEADVVVLAAAATDETRKLFDARRIALLRPQSVLVNIARGELIDTDALVEALREERLYGAGFDVTDPEPLPDGHPLWSEERAIITPHSADTHEMTQPLLAGRVRDNVEAFIGGKDFVGIVDPASGY